MLKKATSFIIFLLFILCFNLAPVFACDTCGCTLARCGMKDTAEKKWFFDFTTEQQNWDVIDAHEAHTLHHQGHDAHDKTHEEFYHFTLGSNVTEDVTVLAEIPYVVRHFLDIEHHATLGKKLTSEGIGDLNLTAIYRFVKSAQGFLGAVVGIKLPTGSTTETDDFGDLYEPELQPGTGSYDYTVGAAFQYGNGQVTFHGNALYIIKGQGDQEFEYGDLFSSYLILDYMLNPDSASFNTKLGIDLNIQADGKQTASGEKVADSGGTTLLLGPAVTVQANDHVSFFGNFLVPVYQNLGGVHQEVDYVWNAGAKIAW